MAEKLFIEKITNMKTIFYTQHLADQNAFKKGTDLVTEKLKTIGVDFQFETVPSTKNYTVIQNQTTKVWGIDNQILISEIKEQGKSADIHCLMYNWDFVTQKIFSVNNPIMPSHANYTVNGGTLVNISENWYNDLPEVFCQFFLHELCHSFSYLKGVQDKTHDQSLYPEWRDKQPNEYYLYLLSTLIGKPTSPTSRPVIKEGMHSKDVFDLQVMLQLLGYFQSKTSSYFGEITKKAVMAFQKDNGLAPDGIVGPKTWTALLGGTDKKKL